MFLNFWYDFFQTEQTYQRLPLQTYLPQVLREIQQIQGNTTKASLPLYSYRNVCFELFFRLFQVMIN